ncbi:MAG: hypothetical protein HQL45_17390 [Alphaproteobacteria bacterium]|nr:hypothetical protein [Alphaproteobacteria bacterium]
MNEAVLVVLEDRRHVALLDALAQGDYQAAMRLALPFALTGNAYAQALIGAGYLSGFEGTPPDQIRAWAWTCHAARAGETTAIELLPIIEGMLSSDEIVLAWRESLSITLKVQERLFRQWR